MKFFIKITILLLFSIFSSKLLAQQKDKVEVSPNLTKKTVLKKCKELNLGKVVHKEQPDYPNDAKLSRVGGTVTVGVKIDEKGNVIEILKTDGHQLLQNAAIEAAKKAKFTPTICDGQVAQINAVMIYNFIPFVITDNYFIPQNIEDFTDITNESEYFEAILVLTENYKLAFGYGDKKFHSKSPLTKGDFAHFLRLTLDLLKKRSELANKNPNKIGLFKSYNPQKIKSIDEIADFKEGSPFSKSLEVLILKYKICLIDEQNKFHGKYPLTQNEVIDYWTKIFGEDAIPIHFRKLITSDKILTRGEFSLFLQESLYVLTYKVLP